MTKTKGPKVWELPGGDLYILDEPKPLEDVKNVPLHGGSLLEEKYRKAIDDYHDQVDRECLELLNEKSDGGPTKRVDRSAQLATMAPRLRKHKLSRTAQ